MKSTELIQPTAIQTPIAVSGDKVIPNQTATNINTSSISAGFLPITQQPLDTGGQAPERTDFNGMFYLSTDQRVYLQNGGFITYDPDVVSKIGGYPQNAILGYMDGNGNFGFVKSLIDDNAYNFVKNPSYINNTYWTYVHLNNTDNDITALTNSINILSSQCVKLSGNQTIGDNKTFTGTTTFAGAIIAPNSATVGTPITTAAISENGNGYLKMGNGIIIQWGYDTNNSNHTRKVTFPTAFGSTVRVVANNMSSSIRTKNTQVYSANKTGFTLYCEDYAFWIAIGY